ncbi:MAG: LCP family protein [Bacillota bacterium]
MSKKVILCILILLSLSLFLLGCQDFLKPSPSREEDKPPLAESQIPTNVSEELVPDITNIALFGIDTGREKYEAIHSDAIMILSIDRIHKKIKLSSLMRDTYVEIKGKKNNKLNTAYAMGGPELAVETIRENFGIDIEDYVTVDFVGLSHIIDALGGVDIDVKEKEIGEINKYMKEVAEIKKEKSTPITESGMQLLNGNQAVAYGRIRKVGDGDFDRTERQKNLLTALYHKITDQEVKKYPAVAAALFPYVETSMSPSEILSLGMDVLKLDISEVDWYRFPLDGYYKGKIIDKVWYLSADLEATAEHVHKFIYDDIKEPPL